MASATSYQNFSPRALEPYPIESKLAELSYGSYGNSPAEAQTALDQNWYERQLNEGVYGQEVAAQHEEARKNIAAQMQAARWKAMGEAKDPTVLQLMANSPDSPLNDVDRNALSDLVLRARHGQDVTDLQHAGTAANQLSQGGYDPTGAMTNVGITNLGPYRGPALVQAAQIRLQGDLAKAAAHKAAGAAIPGGSTTYTNPLTGLPESINRPKGMSDADWVATLKQRGVPMVDQQPDKQQIPQEQAQRDESTARVPSTPPPPARSLTNVPPAPAAKTTSNTEAGVRDVQQKVQRDIHNYPPAVQADIRAGAAKNGGAPMVVPDGKGGYAVKGDKGSYQW
jgi:hypothetical protein